MFDAAMNDRIVKIAARSLSLRATLRKLDSGEVKIGDQGVMDDLLLALDWKGGTIHQAIEEARKRVADPVYHMNALPVNIN